MPQLQNNGESFVVEEIPQFTPCGEGEFTWLWIEKNNLHTDTLIRILRKATGCKTRQFGVAGRKDKLSLSRQWLCLPSRFEDQIPQAGDSHGGSWKLLTQKRHNYPLRMGQLLGNRFTLLLEDVDATVIQTAIKKIEKNPLLNIFGQQRFGHDQQNLTAMQAWSAGKHQKCIDILTQQQQGDAGLLYSLIAAAKTEKNPETIFKKSDKTVRQYFASVAQSHVFNCIATARAERGLLQTVREGDLLLRSGKSAFHVRADEIEQLQSDLDQGIVATTGPLPGTKVRRPGNGILEEEQQWARESGIGWKMFDRGSVFASPGERRRLILSFIEAPRYDAESQKLEFALAAGSFATVFMEALNISDPRRNNTIKSEA